MLIKIHLPIENSWKDLLIKMKINYGNFIIIVTASIVNGMLENFFNLVNGSRSQEFDQRMSTKNRIAINAENPNELSSPFMQENEITNGKVF